MIIKPELKVGDIAPLFELKDQNEQKHNLSELRGKKVLLSWHPLAWTSVCAKQMQSLEDNFDIFSSLNTIAFGLSIDHTFCKKAWAESLGITKTPLLSDFWQHGKTAEEYGCFINQLGFSGRCNIVVNEEGFISLYKVYEIKELPDINEIVSFLRG